MGAPIGNKNAAGKRGGKSKKPTATPVRGGLYKKGTGFNPRNVNKFTARIKSSPAPGAWRG